MIRFSAEHPKLTYRWACLRATQGKKNIERVPCLEKEYYEFQISKHHNSWFALVIALLLMDAVQKNAEKLLYCFTHLLNNYMSSTLSTYLYCRSNALGRVLD